MIWPFKKKDKPTVKPKADGEVHMKFVGEMVSIPEIDFFGCSTQSPNGEFILAWRDADPAGRRGGFRESGDGDYYLIHNEKVIAEGRMERPNQGHVANNGNFVLADWHFGQSLNSTFYAFDKNGGVLLQREFGANALHNGLSNDGRFATYMTAGGDHKDASKLSLFDIDDDELLWSKWPESGRPDSYQFDPREATLWLVYNNKGKFAYSMTDGDFIDWERWETERIDWARPWELSQIGLERLKTAPDPISLEEGAEIAFVLKKAIATGISDAPPQHAKTLKGLGDLWVRLGDDNEALKCFEEASDVHEKAGVKMRIAAIQKRASLK